MEQAQPPLLESIPPRPHTPRYRWVIHLVLLTSYPLLVGAVGFFSDRSAGQPIIPTNSLSLLLVMSAEILTFGFVFGLAWLASRASAGQLMLTWKNGLRTIWRGFLYSIGLRLLIVLVLLLLGLVATGWGISSEDLGKKLHPQTEQLVNAQALVKDPLYLFLNLTFVSFIVAGLREEFWRAGMLAGLFAVFPRLFDNPRGRLAAVGLAALVFGVGHLVQGWGGVAMTTLLGVGLGAIMVYHRSIWEAVLAHGFFDAGTFAMLYLLARFRPDWIPGTS